MNRNKKHAFTLAELLTAVLVISVILVALAPVITKRMKDNISIENTDKEGLQVYLNPGKYAFHVPVGINTLFIQGAGGGGGGGGASYIEKEATFKSSEEWTVPIGVYQVTVTLYGAGGGGGGGYGKIGNDECASPGAKFPSMADNGKDLCYFSRRRDNTLPYNSPNVSVGSDIYIAKPGDGSRESICFRYDPNDSQQRPFVTSIQHRASNSQDPRTMLLCSPTGADIYCSCYLPKQLGWVPPCAGNYGTSGSNSQHPGARIITTTELKRLLDQSPAPNYKYLTPQYLDLVGENITKYHNNGADKLTSVGPTDDLCHILGSNSAGYCWVYRMYSDSGQLHWHDWNSSKLLTAPTIEYSRPQVAARPVCVYEMQNWTPYGGGGGASGAKYTQTINVLPGDTLKMTVGDGGAGGSARNNGSSGGRTKLIHKRSGVDIETYYADGGVGGNGAKPTGAGDKTNVAATCSHTSGCSPVVSDDSGIGYAGSDANGGKGSGGVAGGTPDETPTKGDSNTSFGGGGGFCNRNVRSASSCQSGAKGGSGKVEISYKIIMGGSGGGSGARVAGIQSSTNKQYEIKYKVDEGDTVAIEIGSGGLGGSAGQNGLNGTTTIVGDNDVVFFAGEGGKAPTQEQKEELKNCIGTQKDSTYISNCVKTRTKPLGGQSGVINKIGTIQTTALGLILNSSKASYAPTGIGSFRGESGSTPLQVSGNIDIWKYGFDGGIGGAPFGISESEIQAAVSCGGGIITTYQNGSDATSYRCTSGNINGNSGRVHDAAKNQLGGSGGGGGGIIEGSSEVGIGGSGSNGYLRIRWNVSEQE